MYTGRQKRLKKCWPLFNIGFLVHWAETFTQSVLATLMDFHLRVARKVNAEISECSYLWVWRGQECDREIINCSFDCCSRTGVGRVLVLCAALDVKQTFDHVTPLNLSKNMRDANMNATSCCGHCACIDWRQVWCLLPVQLSQMFHLLDPSRKWTKSVHNKNLEYCRSIGPQDDNRRGLQI